MCVHDLEKVCACIWECMLKELVYNRVERFCSDFG